jgi:hypothetical protein
MNETFTLTWQGQDIGSYEIVHSDMGIMDGNWTGNGSPAAADFKKLIGTFEIKKVFAKPQLGTMALLRSGRNEIHVFVLGMIQDMLTLKTVSDQGAIDWLQKTMKNKQKQRPAIVRMFRRLAGKEN